MPTGYTADVADGSIKDFKTFALRCARNFGACITMRDEPWDAEIPEEFKPSTYNKENLDLALKELDNLQKLTDKEIKEKCQKAYEEELASYKKYKADKLEQKQRYEKMLEQVKAWNPPTSNHENMKKFMIDQLSESLEFDCSDYRSKPIMITSEEWFKKELDRINYDIRYYKKHMIEEDQRCKERTEWVKALRNSL